MDLDALIKTIADPEHGSWTEVSSGTKVYTPNPSFFIKHEPEDLVKLFAVIPEGFVLHMPRGTT